MEYHIEWKERNPVIWTILDIYYSSGHYGMGFQVEEL